MLGQFITPGACRLCGGVDKSVTLLAPSLSWKSEMIELVYPLRCPCGGSGSVPIRIPTLFFGYMLAVVAMDDAARLNHLKANMTVHAPRNRDLLDQIVRQFQALMCRCSCTHKNIQLNELCLGGEPEHMKFGLEPDEWARFLRRLGFEDHGNGSL